VTSCRRAILNVVIGAIVVAVSGCAGPPVLERQVLGYDKVTKMLDEKLLLLNIARVSTEETTLFRRQAAKKWPLRGSLKRAAGCL